MLGFVAAIILVIVGAMKVGKWWRARRFASKKKTIIPDRRSAE